MAAVETFVIRVWVPPEAQAEEPRLRGVAQHVASGRSRAFRDAEQLLAFLAGAPGDAEVAVRLEVPR